MTYSSDFRLHVLNFRIEHEMTFEELSAHFCISVRSLFRWNNRLEPCKTRDKPATKVNMDALAKDVEDFPDAFQKERAERLGVSQSSVSYALKRLNITRKKIANSSKTR